MSILFINGSPNKNGNTVRLTKKFLKDQEFKTLNLVDYKIYSYGQNFEDDQLDEVIEQMKQADTIIIGSPLYWHSMSGAIRNVLDRFYGREGQARQGCLKRVCQKFCTDAKPYKHTLSLPYKLSKHKNLPFE